MDIEFVKNVWKTNLAEEFTNIREVVRKYNFISVDSEFPGIVIRQRINQSNRYLLMSSNIRSTRIIQLGLTFMDKNGKMPPGCSTWQFNFEFNLLTNVYAHDSIELLKNSGIQFEKHEKDGIYPLDFIKLFKATLLNNNITWLGFHSVYDFGYMIDLLTDFRLPLDESEFNKLLGMYFPTIYDVKYLMLSCHNLRGGLQNVANQLNLRRVGTQHQAGSDSHLTGMVFFKIKQMFFEGNIDNNKYCGRLYGLDTSFTHLEINTVENNQLSFDNNKNCGRLNGLGAPLTFHQIHLGENARLNVKNNRLNVENNNDSGRVHGLKAPLTYHQFHLVENDRLNIDYKYGGRVYGLETPLTYKQIYTE